MAYKVSLTRPAEDDAYEESEEGPRVRVLRIWHGHRDVHTASDIDAE
jgi:hypothetical protein